MSEDDDWFERALRDEDAEDDDVDESVEEAELSEEVETVSEDDELAEDDVDETADEDANFEEVEPVGEADSGDETGELQEPADSAATDPVPDDSATTDPAEADGPDDASGSDAFGDDTETAGGFADAPDPSTADSPDGSEGDGLFEDDFASAFENAPGGGVGGGGESDGEAGGFGMDAGADFGGDDGGGGFGDAGGFGDSGEPFDDEFAADEEFESDIPRTNVGIEGLDNMIQGGVPERTLMTTIGSAGTGKTTFGLQFLHEALVEGESAVYITLEESRERIVNTATEKGWGFEEYVDEGRLAVIDLDPIEMANSLTSIRNDLPRLIEEFGASRLVLDSVSLLEMMYDDQATRRNEVYDFTKSLKQAGVTTMLTSEANEDNPYASRHGIIEYLVDAVFILRYIRNTDDFRETRLAVEIQKIRDANHSREIKPYAITNEGISVYRQANIF